jgi:hypothetical protein
MAENIRGSSKTTRDMARAFSDGEMEGLTEASGRMASNME